MLANDKIWEKRRAGPCGARSCRIEDLWCWGKAAGHSQSWATVWEAGLEEEGETKEAGDLVTAGLPLQLGCVSFVMPEENGWSKTLKEKESWLGHEDFAVWFCVNLTHAGVI